MCYAVELAGSPKRDETQWQEHCHADVDDADADDDDDDADDDGDDVPPDNMEGVVGVKGAVGRALKMGLLQNYTVLQVVGYIWLC